MGHDHQMANVTMKKKKMHCAKDNLHRLHSSYKFIMSFEFSLQEFLHLFYKDSKKEDVFYILWVKIQKIPLFLRADIRHASRVRALTTLGG